MAEGLLHRNRCVGSISWVYFTSLTACSIIPPAYRSRSLWCKVVVVMHPEADHGWLVVRKYWSYSDSRFRRIPLYRCTTLYDVCMHRRVCRLSGLVSVFVFANTRELKLDVKTGTGHRSGTGTGSRGMITKGGFLEVTVQDISLEGPWTDAGLSSLKT